LETQKERDNLKEPSVDGRVIGTMTLKKPSRRLLAWFICIRRDSGGWCELGNEALAATNCWEFIDSLRKCMFMKMTDPWNKLQMSAVIW